MPLKLPLRIEGSRAVLMLVDGDGRTIAGTDGCYGFNPDEDKLNLDEIALAVNSRDGLIAVIREALSHDIPFRPLREKMESALAVAEGRDVSTAAATPADPSRER